jgi:fatty acid desaturase
MMQTLKPGNYGAASSGYWAGACVPAWRASFYIANVKTLRPEVAAMASSVNGLTPLWIFFIASMAIVGAVVLAGLVASWWMLLPVMLIFFGSVTGVLFIIMRQLRDDG